MYTVVNQLVINRQKKTVKNNRNIIKAKEEQEERNCRRRDVDYRVVGVAGPQESIVQLPKSIEKSEEWLVKDSEPVICGRPTTKKKKKKKKKN